MTIEKQLAFSGDEFRRRLDCLRCVAASRGLDVVLLFNPSNTFYLTGFFSVNLWDFQCLIVPLSGEPMLVIREFETGRFKASCRLQEPWTYPPEGSGPAALIEALKHMKCERARLGVEMSRFLDAKSFAALSSGLPGTVFSDATDVLDDARAVKSTEEIVYLRRAAAITDSGMEAAVSAIRERCSDYAVAAEANRATPGGRKRLHVHRSDCRNWAELQPCPLYRERRRSRRGRSVSFRLVRSFARGEHGGCRLSPAGVHGCPYSDNH